MKPDFWEDEVIGTLSRDARLLFIACWNFADDTGILRWSQAYLKASVFMYDHDLDADQVGFLMDELTGKNLVSQYTVEKTGQVLAQVVNFRKHQVINRPQPSKFPRPPWEADPSVNDSLNDSLNPPTLFTVGRGEGKGKGKEKEEEGEGKSRATRFPPGFDFTPEMLDYAKSKDSRILWSAEFDKFRSYHEAKGSKFVSWEAAWRKWVLKAVEFAKEKTPAPAQATRENWY